MGDLSVIVGPGERFCLNLGSVKDAAEKSSWVKAMLKYEGVNGEIHLPQTDPKTFKQLLKVLSYDQSIMTGSREEVMDILCQANMWDFSNIVKKCCEYYSTRILMEYDFIFNNIAMLDLQNDLEVETFYLLKWNIVKAFKNKSFLDWGTITWIRVLQSDNISLEEIVIFKAVKEWQETNNIPLSEVRRLMKLIRFPLMAENDFEKHVSNSGFLHAVEIEKIRKYFLTKIEFGLNNCLPRRLELGIHDGIEF